MEGAGHRVAGDWKTSHYDQLISQSEKPSKLDAVFPFQVQVTNLTSQLDVTTQDLTARNEHLASELKQQAEDAEKECEKLTLQAQQLSVELEKSHELIALKNQDALKLQQDILSLEEKLREATSQLKQAQESLNIELETREKLDHRYDEQQPRGVDSKSKNRGQLLKAGLLLLF